MKLHLNAKSGQQLFTSYGPGYVVVNGERHVSSLVVLPDRVTPWTATTFDALTDQDMAPLAELDRDVVLLATGPRLRFPRPEILRPLTEARIGVEVMDVAAACRTYNILVAEDRRVACAVLLV